MPDLQRRHDRGGEGGRTGEGGAVDGGAIDDGDAGPEGGAWSPSSLLKRVGVEGLEGARV